MFPTGLRQANCVKGTNNLRDSKEKEISYRSAELLFEAPWFLVASQLLKSHAPIAEQSKMYLERFESKQNLKLSLFPLAPFPEP